MPTTAAIQHQPWCQGHVTEDAGEVCELSSRWSEGGSMFADHISGEAESVVGIDYRGQTIDLHIGDLLPLRREIDELLKDAQSVREGPAV